MQRRDFFAGLLSLCLLILAPFAQSGDTPASGVGSLSWKKTQVQSTLPDKEAHRAAATYLGLAAAAAAPPDQSTFVKITDNTRYGNVTKTVFYGWQLHYSGVTVVNKISGASSKVSLTVLIDGSIGANRRPTKALVAAFTDINRATWREPVLPRRDYSQAMQDDGWAVDRLSTTPLNANVTQVLAALWANHGIDPAQAGQILLRPMQVSLALPAKRDSGGRLQPLMPKGIYWVALVTGTKTRSITGPDPMAPSPVTGGGERYMTGLAALFSDIDAQPVRGIYLP